MNKEFIPYEEALALKELGFDESCLGFYLNGNNIVAVGTDRVFTSEDLPIVKSPLYQQAFRWFRKEHGLQHSIDIDISLEDFITIKCREKGLLFESKKTYKTYEEAELACLKKLIEIVKTKN